MPCTHADTELNKLDFSPQEKKAIEKKIKELKRAEDATADHHADSLSYLAGESWNQKLADYRVEREENDRKKKQDEFKRELAAMHEEAEKKAVTVSWGDSPFDMQSEMETQWKGSEGSVIATKEPKFRKYTHKWPLGPPGQFYNSVGRMMGISTMSTKYLDSTIKWLDKTFDYSQQPYAGEKCAEMKRARENKSNR